MYLEGDINGHFVVIDGKKFYSAYKVARYAYENPGVRNVEDGSDVRARQEAITMMRNIGLYVSKNPITKQYPAGKRYWVRYCKWVIDNKLS